MGGMLLGDEVTISVDIEANNRSNEMIAVPRGQTTGYRDAPSDSANRPSHILIPCHRLVIIASDIFYDL